MDESEGFEPLNGYSNVISSDEMEARAHAFLETALRRRSIRAFSERPVPQSVVEACIRTAGSAPSGANLQPWHFVAVSDPGVKREIRISAEREEREFYHRRAPQEWLDALAPMGTNEQKPFLETAPWLIAVFAQTHGQDDSGKKLKHYYVAESVGIATGMLIAALNDCGLATLTHTPSPMKFLNTILGRPGNERPFLLLVVGFPAEDCKVPKLIKKTFDQIATWITNSSS